MKKNSVLLVNTPSAFQENGRIMAPTGVLYAAGILEEAGLKVHIRDLERGLKPENVGKSYREIDEECLRECREAGANAGHDYDVIGISATTPQVKYAMSVLEGIRRVNPGAKVVLGGPHATVVAEFREECIDRFRSEEGSGQLVSLGKRKPKLSTTEGRTLVQTVSHTLEARLNEFDPNFKPLEAFDHIVAGDASGMLEALRPGAPKWIWGEPGNVENIPFPARHLIEIHSYNFLLADSKGNKFPTTTMLSQWGCPYGCLFCCGRDTPFYRKIRKPSVERTVAELLTVNEKYGFTGFMFYDDEINADPKHFDNLISALGKLHKEKGFVYRAFIKCERAVEKPDTFNRLVDSGFVEVCTGVESGAPDVLEFSVQKNTTPEHNRLAAERAFEAGIRLKAFTMVGHPGEREDHIRQTEEYLKHPGISTFDVTILTPYPGAPNYDRARRNADGVFYLTTRELAPNNLAMSERIMKEWSVGLDEPLWFFTKRDFSKTDSFYKGCDKDYAVSATVWTPSLTSERLVELRSDVEHNVKTAKGLRVIDRANPFDSSMGMPAGIVYSGKNGSNGNGKYLSNEQKKIAL